MNENALISNEEELQKEPVSYADQTEYYNQFYREVVRRGFVKEGTTFTAALDSLPQGQEGDVNWTSAVMGGFIAPRGSIELGVEEEQVLDLTIFIEAKVPLMSNVIFPHSIHTYWLNCATCHPKIFIPKAGANPITMDEIFAGKWCGRCHGKVAFDFFPLANCRRCHVVMKGESLGQERWR